MIFLYIVCGLLMLSTITFAGFCLLLSFSIKTLTKQNFEASKVLEQFVKDSNLSLKAQQTNIELLQSNVALKEKHEEYKQFLELTYQVLRERSIFMRSEFIKRFGMNIPELNELNGQIIEFENALNAIYASLEEYKLVD